MIIVYGSINMETNISLKAFPQAGETVLSPSYTSTPGGKGANQALAAARSGAKTALVGKVGDDGPGLRVLNNLKRNEVMTSGVAKSDDLPTGMAIIVRGKKGDNRTIVASGANMAVTADQAPPDIFHAGNILLVQMEVPLEQSAIVIKNAYDQGAKVIMNLAPSLAVPKVLLSLVDYLIVNQIEAKQLAERYGVDISQDAVELAKVIAKENNLTCIITMGPEGVVAIAPNGRGVKLPSLKLPNVVDTAGAGDCFCGTFAACIHEKMLFEQALRRATVASGLSCMTQGTQESYPYLADIDSALKEFDDPTPIM